MQLYTIKPLVWEDAGIDEPGSNDECSRATPYSIYVSSDHTFGKWVWWYEITISDENIKGERIIVRHNGYQSKDEAKYAAEYAYRELIKQALEPATPQSPSPQP